MRFTTDLAALVLVAVTLGAGLVATAAQAQEPPKQPTRAQARVVFQACKADAQALCSTVSPGQGRVLACLKEQEQNVSQGCRDAMASIGY